MEPCGVCDRKGITRCPGCPKLVQKQTAQPETGGTFTCPECVKFYQHAKDWEKRYYAIKALFSSALSAENKLTKKELRERLEAV